MDSSLNDSSNLIFIMEKERAQSSFFTSWHDFFDEIVCLDCIDSENWTERHQYIQNQILLSGMHDVRFASMQRMPYIKNIVKGCINAGKIISGLDYTKSATFKSLDYSLNLVRILKELRHEKKKKVLFFEDDVCFINNPDIIRETLQSEPHDNMISLYDGYITQEQYKFSGIKEFNGYWDSYMMLWNIDLFSLNADGIDFMISAMQQKLAYPDYYTWACTGNPIKLFIPSLWIPEYSKTVSHLKSRIPLGIQNPQFEKNAIHDEKNEKNALHFDISQYNI